MTAPVLTLKERDSKVFTMHQSDLHFLITEKQVMSFVMPSQYQTIDQLPASVNPEVKLQELPERTVAAVRFAGL